MRTAVVYSPAYLLHETGGHVENAGRLKAVISALKEPPPGYPIKFLDPRPALEVEIATVHAEKYMRQVKELAEKGGGYLDSDTVVSPLSYEAATMAAGGSIRAVQAVMDGEADFVFAAVRPPGHHATCWQGMGFCLFNNVAVATKWATRNYNIDRVIIVDFDVHHGNGTQDAFYHDPHVLYFSVHQSPLYPGSGGINEIGHGKGEGYNVNVPMLPGWGDEEYLEVFQRVLMPIAERYKPQLIMVSAGYDAHWADPISSMSMSVSGYADITWILRQMARKLSLDRLVFCLEGGYHYEALAKSVRASFDVVNESRSIDDPLGRIPQFQKPAGFGNLVRLVRKTHNIKS